MRMFITATLAALVCGGAVQAQDHGHDEPHGLAHPAIAEAHKAAADAQQRKQCQAMFRAQMGAKPVDKHHAADGSPSGKPLSAAEMKAMHEKCDVVMAKPAPAASKP